MSIPEHKYSRTLSTGAVIKLLNVVIPSCIGRQGSMYDAGREDLKRTIVTLLADDLGFDETSDAIRREVKSLTNG